MFDSVSQSDGSPAGQQVPAFMRANGRIKAGFMRSGASTRIATLYETGGLRMRFPKGGDTCEGVILNTAGGVAGGDRLEVSLTAGQRTHVVLTTQAAEKVYRAEAIPATVDVTVTAEPRATLQWLPQETILFDGARLKRTFMIDMAETARVTILECVVFGRLGANEPTTTGSLRDSWRLRRGGRLVFAEEVRLDGAVGATLDRPACGNGARAVATFVHAGRGAEKRLGGLRRVLAKATSICGASVVNDVLVARLANVDPAALREDVRRVVEFVTRAAVPRVWSC